MVPRDLMVWVQPNNTEKTPTDLALTLKEYLFSLVLIKRLPLASGIPFIYEEMVNSSFMESEYEKLLCRNSKIKNINNLS